MWAGTRPHPHPGPAPGRPGLDPRLIQIAILATLLASGVTSFDPLASLGQGAVTLAAALAAQAVGNRLRGERVDWRSPAITALSLTLLLRAHDPLLWAASGAVAVGSKFIVRVGGKHLFNPACFAIVALLGWCRRGLCGNGLGGSSPAR